MKSLLGLVVLALCILVAPVSADPVWTISASAGISTGTASGPSLAWRGEVHHFLAPRAALGLEVGRHRYALNDGAMGYLDATAIPFASGFSSLARGGGELQHASLSFWRLGRGSRSAPCLAVGIGLYRTTPAELWHGENFNRPVNPGASVGFGFAGVRGFVPSASLRLDLVDTRPEGSVYLTAGFGLDACFGWRSHATPRPAGSI